MSKRLVNKIVKNITWVSQLMLLASWEQFGVSINVIVWWVHWDFPFLPSGLSREQTPAQLPDSCCLPIDPESGEEERFPPETNVAASQWLWEFSIHLDSEEEAIGRMGKACQHAHRKPVKVRTEIFRGTESHWGGQEVGTILGKKVGPVTGTDSLLL